MKFISLGDSKKFYPLREVVFKGLAPDGNLFMPERIPVLEKSFLESFHQMKLDEIAQHVLYPYVSEDISNTKLKDIIKGTFSFDIPLKKLNGDLFALELFHGPTQAFKDVGARFLARLLAYFNEGEKRKLLVLTATSGDTGGAVANGFHNTPGIDVVVLYPYGKVSPYQEYQITGPGENIHAIAVEGSFDDCQRLVKDAFNDQELRQKLFITSANSINMGRLLPQSVYYFQAVALLRQYGIYKEPVIIVPSGNFGNITAAVLANKMGLPVKRFIAATNANDVVPRFLESGKYEPHETIITIANAMDVGDPSNFSRLFNLYDNDISTIRNKLRSVSVSDEEIKDTIKKVYLNQNYLMDPHTASAYMVAELEKKQDETGVFISTAHPYKFNEVIDEILPGELEKSGYNFQFENKKEKNVMKPDYLSFKNRLISMNQN